MPAWHALAQLSSAAHLPAGSPFTPLLIVAAAAALIAASALLLVAALHDLAVRTVPNWLCAALLPAGFLLRLLDGTLLRGLLAAFLVLLGCYVCWRRGWMGGGDVKLLAAAALAVPPGSALGFLAAVALAGSGLALIYLIARRLVAMPRHTSAGGLLARVARAERWRIRRGGPLPYACAIAAGFLFVIL
jgi:prepilin peptidase CpaA